MGAKSIDEFCKSNGGFSRATYYNLKRAGKGPREMAVGSRVFISDDAEAEWQRQREADAGTSAKSSTTFPAA